MYSSLQGVAPYPTMSWEELADLPVSKLADPKMSALFMWATGPLIHKVIALMESWGFEYVLPQLFLSHTNITRKYAAIRPRSAMGCGTY